MDPRVARTRRRLQESLLVLARERTLDEITVGDIAERAAINRSTYYQHYSDKEMLLADALDAAAAQAAELIGEAAGARRGAGDWGPWVDAVGARAAMLTYLRHVEENADLYRRVLGEHGSAVATSRMRRRVEVIVRDALAGSPQGEVAPFAEGVPLHVAAAGITGLAIGVVTSWVEQDADVPAAEAAEWLWAMLDHQGLLPT
ncbi:TetR/AcrR family transcriptional regulator [Pseudokineococcus basanitobsidens]|uniref:TetR/AcrR family transcriptional regulator n=1 Tax=Pseudokineococcus basanitobsidens TaxID=1926649 RepID=A0ABU8RP99_9ACTN